MRYIAIFLLSFTSLLAHAAQWVVEAEPGGHVTWSKDSVADIHAQGGLTLMEAVGSGLPIIGFDVRYGNQNFIDEGKNGYKIPVHDKMDSKERIAKLAECVIKMFTEDDMEEFHRHSYEKAKKYLTIEVEKGWMNVLDQIR